MAVSKYALLEERLAVVEARLDALQMPAARPKRPLVEVVLGTFANDPDFEKAMELGRKYRESLRPKPRAKKKSNMTKRKSK
ncbi:MAG TPA: hypothetical protein VFZ34_32145 [Blastocatellia bacterium]|nr:hypothetical protein [Blastocatellia bacterium]